MTSKSFFDIGIANNWQFGFSIPASPVMEGIVNFHHDLFFFLVVIIGFVGYVLWRSMVLFKYNKSNTIPHVVTHASALEIIWTIIPALILIVIAIPSFSLLYSMDEIIEPLLTVKIIGHQWYWSYEFLNPYYYLSDVYKNNFDKSSFSDVSNFYNNLLKQEVKPIISYDSYMIPSENSVSIKQRLLEVDNKLILPCLVDIRLLITSADVLHSWAVPTLGIKVDACPGRLNQTSVFINRPGFFYGQCSEICGINHGFMPIMISSFHFSGDLKNSFYSSKALFFYLLRIKYDN